MVNGARGLCFKHETVLGGVSFFCRNNKINFVFSFSIDAEPISCV